MSSNPLRIVTRTVCLALLITAAAQAGVRQGVTLDIRPDQAPPREEPRLYIVQMDAPPALALHEPEAQPAGFRLFRKPGLRRFDPRDGRVQTYVRRLKAAQDAMLDRLDAQRSVTGSPGQ